MEKIVACRKYQMKLLEPTITEDDGDIPTMTSNMKSLGSLVPIGLIFFIMLSSAAIYYFFTAILSGFS